LKVTLVRLSATSWRLQNDKSLLHDFSVLDANEAKRHAQAWVSSFAHTIILEVPDECDTRHQETEKTGSTKDSL
jgi:hypothetical protein